MVWARALAATDFAVFEKRPSERILDAFDATDFEVCLLLPRPLATGASQRAERVSRRPVARNPRGIAGTAWVVGLGMARGNGLWTSGTDWTGVPGREGNRVQDEPAFVECFRELINDARQFASGNAGRNVVSPSVEAVRSISIPAKGYETDPAFQQPAGCGVVVVYPEYR